jgi:hypothetical protein
MNIHKYNLDNIPDMAETIEQAERLTYQDQLFGRLNPEEKKTEIINPELLSVEQSARVLGLSKGQFISASRDIGRIKVNRSNYFTIESLRKYVRLRKDKRCRRLETYTCYICQFREIKNDIICSKCLIKEGTK